MVLFPHLGQRVTLSIAGPCTSTKGKALKIGVKERSSGVKVSSTAVLSSSLMVKRVRRSVAAAEKSEMAGFIKPQLATLKCKAPVGPQWLHEIKFDGYRVQIHMNKGWKVYTRNRLDWTHRFSVIVGALDIPGQAIIDGR
jgi:ATP-dependent DNA ligase